MDIGERLVRWLQKNGKRINLTALAEAEVDPGIRVSLTPTDNDHCPVDLLYSLLFDCEDDFTAALDFCCSVLGGPPTIDEACEFIYALIHADEVVTAENEQK